MGAVIIGEVTFESAAYVARYVTKKITGKKSEEHYKGKTPEYVTMSRGRKPEGGIGTRWFQKYKSDVYPDDFVVIRGKKMRPPKFYDNLYQEENPSQHQKVKQGRKIDHPFYPSKDNTQERLKVREFVHKAQTKILKRNLEENDI